MSVTIPGISGGVLTSYKNWVNGNSNGSKSHWREGEFISYRVIISGAGSGPHTVVFTYDTVHSGGHAEDYLGSFDATETTSATTTSSGATIIHANNNNPCQDLVAASQMPAAQCGATYSAGVQTHAATPVATVATPHENFGSGPGGEQGCGGAGGSFTGSQAAGTIDLFGPSGSTLSTPVVVSDNVPSGTGNCTTTVSLDFNLSSSLVSGQSVVIAWGGHIACGLCTTGGNWGAGNSASSISGSPYHESLNTLDGASTGSQDRALAASAIFFTPSISTTLHNAAGNGVIAVGGTVPVGTSVYDTATLTNAASNAGGTVTYSFFHNETCSGTPASTQTVNVTNAIVPQSTATGALAPGSYAFQATYSGDGSDLAPPPSSCENFIVGQGTSTVATTVFDATTNAAWSGTETTGASAYDTATVTTSPTSPVATGTVTYTFFTNGTCTGTGTGAGTVTLTASGSVPNSNTESTLAPGSYSFDAAYSGDSNFSGNTSPCEPFSVAKGTSTTATVVVQSGSATGASAYDTATVTTSDTIVATGTVTYTFFGNGTCTGTGTSAGTVTLAANGSVPNSSTEGPPLAAGSYSFQATYSGDSNYGGSTGACEPFSIGKGTSTTATTVVQSGSTTGASAYDTATVATSDTIVATGTVTYTFFTNGTCSGSGTSAGTVTLAADGSVPNSSTEGPPLAAGSYSFQAIYSGDGNYGGSTGPCEPFSIGKGTSTTATTVVQSGTSTGSSAYDTATVSTSDTIVATGTVTYTFFSNGTCGGSGTSAGTVTLTAAGAVPNSNTEGPPLAAGSYSFQATYSGDGNYAGSTGPCEPFTVSPGTSTTNTVVVQNGSTTGASAYDTATVSTSDTIVATGTVTYTFFSNGTCSGSGTSAGTVTLAADGSVPNSSTEGPPLAAGSYSFQAVYSGDSNYAGSTGPCEPFTVGPGTSTTNTVVVQNGTTTGASAFDTATVTTSDTIVATGTVTYTFFSNGTCGGSGTSAGTVTLTAAGAVPNSNTEGPPLAAGSYSFQATYSGDGNYAGSTGPCEPFTVSPGTSQTATTVVQDGTSTGSSAFDTATVTTSDTIVATGTVSYTFFSNGTCAGTGTSAGTVTLAADGSVPNSNIEGPPLAAGSYSFRASYSGDSNYGGSTGLCEPFTVSPGTSQTATTVVQNGTSTGSSAFDTATVTTSNTIVATGTVSYSFFSNGTCAGTGTSAGTVTLAADGSVPNSNTEGPPLAAGSYSFQATYSGDGNYGGSTGPCEPFTVTPGTSQTATTVVQNGTSTGASAYDTATVTTSDTIVATGTVSYTFFNNGTCSGSGTSAGTVTLAADGSVPNSNTEGPPLAAGSYSFQAIYSGDFNYGGSTGPCEPFTVSPGTSQTATTVVQNGTSTGSSAYDTATVTTSDTIVATGTVTYTFFTNGTCSGTGTSAGTVTLAADGSVPNSSTEGPPLAAGSYSFQATYSGDGNYGGSTGPCEPFAVSPGTSTTATTVFDAATNAAWAGTETAPASAYDTATVTTSDTIVATGTVTYTFFTNGTCSGTGTSAGTVTLTASGAVPNSNTESGLAGGSYSFQATYSGDSNYGGSTGACEPFSVISIVSQLTPTNTTCSTFSTGASGTQYEIEYSKKGNSISQVNPGVFFYWVKVSTPGTYTIGQSAVTKISGTDTPYSPLFLIQSGSNVFSASGCASNNALSGASITQSNGTVTVTFSTTQAGPYYIGIKYSTSAVVGHTPPTGTCVESDPADPGSVNNCATYTFSIGSVPGSTQSLVLEPKDTA